MADMKNIKCSKRDDCLIGHSSAGRSILLTGIVIDADRVPIHSAPKAIGAANSIKFTKCDDEKPMQFLAVIGSHVMHIGSSPAD
jgi:hypothetical protein